MITLTELKLRLAKQLDVDDLIEELNIEPEDLVERFSDFIEDDFARLAKLVEEEEQEEDE